MGLPRDVVLFGVITGVIIFSQLFLSVTKTLVDRLIYREDRDEIAWLRELDRRLLATTDLRQLLENNLIALCELLRVPSGFVAAAVGPDLILEAVVGPDDTRSHVLSVGDWSEALSRAMRGGPSSTPYSHQGFWVWPLTDTISDEMDEQTRVFGVLGVAARTDTPLLSLDERQVLDTLVLRVTRALADRKLQQSVSSASC